MIRARRVLAVVAVAAVLATAGCAQPAPTRLPPGEEFIELRAAALLEARQTRSDDAVRSRVPADGPGCSAAVAVRGEVVWAGAAGLADLEQGTPLTTSTRFDMASVSKQFTATAILLLQREGKLSLADPIGTYVDGLPAWGRTVTLDQLVHHTSRLPDYWMELEERGIGFVDGTRMSTVLDAIRAIDELEPGEGYLYSNTNYVLLAVVVGEVSGQPLPEFLAERIFAPLELDMVLEPTLRAADVARAYGDDLGLQESGWKHYGHSGIIATPSELASWGDQYRTGDLVQEDFAVGAVPEGAGELYAAGIDIEVDGDLNHTGRMGGYITDFTVSADRQTTIAVMCNGHGSDRFGIASALWGIWRPVPDMPPSD